MQHNSTLCAAIAQIPHMRNSLLAHRAIATLVCNNKRVDALILFSRAEQPRRKRHRAARPHNDASAAIRKGFDRVRDR